VVINAALDAMGEGLREKGVTLDRWLASGRRARGQLLKEKYGLADTGTE
jgi:hypothetical protein